MPQRYIRMGDNWALIYDPSPRKVIYSPGFGAGWVSWAASKRDYKLFLLTHPELIKYIESGKKIPREIEGADSLSKIEKSNPKLFKILTDILEHCLKTWNETPYLGGLHSARVVTVDGEVCIEEFDGNEKICERPVDDEWL